MPFGCLLGINARVSPESPSLAAKKAATLASDGLNLELLLFDLVYAIAGLGLSGFDLQVVLLSGGGEEPAYAVGLPRRCFS
jgi:hypothetical protein